MYKQKFLEKIQKNLKKVVDKTGKLCYIIITKEMRNPVSADGKSRGRAGRVPQKKEKKIKKTLDK